MVKVSHPPLVISTVSSTDIAGLWVREIEEGIERTGIKAGIIKVATSDPITGQEELMLRAKVYCIANFSVGDSNRMSPVW